MKKFFVYRTGLLAMVLFALLLTGYKKPAINGFTTTIAIYGRSLIIMKKITDNITCFVVFLFAFLFAAAGKPIQILK